MKIQPFIAGPRRRGFCITLVLLMASLPSARVVAQGAVQAVRQRVSGLERGPEDPPAETPAAPTAAPAEQPSSPGTTAGKLDTTYVPSTASALVVFRPAQIMTAPMAQMLPIEVASAAGRQFLGIDPADVDELIVFGDLSNPIAPTYGAAVKFNKPFRAVSIPQNVRPVAQLAEFSGKKYLQSAHPFFPSFYGPNNKTLLLAPDAMLRKMVETSGQPKSGTLLDRVREVPAGSDLYLAVDVASLRGVVPLMLGQAQITMPPDAKQVLDSAAALELTVNLVTRGPISMVVHCNDEAAAQQIEAFLSAAKQNFAAASPGEQPAGENPIEQAKAQFRERMYQRFQPQRNGASITCLNIAAEDPVQPQLFGIVVGAILATKAAPAIEAAQQAVGQSPGGPGIPTTEGSPAPPSAAPAAGPEVPPPPETERR